MKSTFGDNRIANILQAFCKTPSISVSLLAAKLEVSERTIRNDIKQLNQELAGCAVIEGAQGKMRCTSLTASNSRRPAPTCWKPMRFSIRRTTGWTTYLAV